MTALSKLVYGEDRWPYFTEKFPLKVKNMKVDSTFLSTLEENIKDAGDALQGRTAAKCLMTNCAMHDYYEAFRLVGEFAMEIAKTIPVAKRTKPNGEIDEVPLYIKESWGLVYQKGQSTQVHNHWPSLWSYTFCVKACSDCSHLVFPTSDEKKAVKPENGQLILFPAWIMHEVPEHTCEHERIMIAGNLNVG